MARGNVLTDRVRSLIAEIYLAHPDRQSLKIREELIKRLHGENPYYDDPQWPRLNTVQKELAKIRKRDAMRQPESKEIDTPWGTIRMAEYPIPPEALPSVLKVWVWIQENMSGPFTIRQAQWAARLYAVTEHIPRLALLAQCHSAVERISELMGQTHPVVNTSAMGVDMTIYQLMTGEEITPEREKKILGLSEEQWLNMKKEHEFLGALNESEFEDMMAKKIVKKRRQTNERSHSQKE